MTVYDIIDLLVNFLKWQIVPGLSAYLLFQILAWIICGLIIVNFFIGRIGGGND